MSEAQWNEAQTGRIRAHSDVAAMMRCDALPRMAELRVRVASCGVFV